MSYLWLDIETYSGVDLKKTGVYPYAASDDFEILFCWWTTDGVEYHVAIGPEEIDKIPGLWDPGVTKVAHNAPFERICFSAFLALLADLVDGPVHEPFLDPDPETWLDTAAWAASLGLPRGLDKLAQRLGIEQKDSAGTRLINWFCKPDPKTGQRRRPEDHPEKWEQFLAYGRQDVVVLYEAHQELIKAGEWPDFERQVYYVDQVINDRGIAVDVETARSAVAADAKNRAEAGQELRELLGVENANSTQQLQAGLQDIGLSLPDMKAETVAAVLEMRNLTSDQRRALELRQQLALSSAKKFEAIIASEVDGRIHGQFAYHGAHTGRWAGRGVQLQNLTRAQAWVAAVLMDLLMGLGALPKDLKGIVRACLLLNGISVDYSAIEARVLGWLAGEEWVLEAFRQKKDIYVEQAARSGAILHVEFTRQDGKTQVLGLGYQGSVGALRRMGAEGTDEKLLGLVRSYRQSNRKIVAFWARLEHAFKVGGKVGYLTVERHGRDRHIVLPSGRRMIYHDVRITGQDERVSFVNNLGVRTATYGGMLTENVTQAVARDLLAYAMVLLHSAGYAIVGHVHDEVLIEGTKDVEAVAEIMCDAPAWADGLPLAAEGAVMDRYRK